MTPCTLVIATHNRRGRLAGTLDQLRALSDRAPIVVVDNDSDDGTAAMVRARYPEVTLVALPTNRGAAARTAGARAARTRYVAFCDDDCCWQSGSLSRAAELLDAYPGVGVINARVLVDERIDPACALMATSPVPRRTGCPGRPIAQFMAGAVVVRRSAFLAAGGYHPRFHIGAEEALLALDLLEDGWELVYDPQLVLVHAPEAAGRRPDERRMLVMRNRLWAAWLRRSPRAALRATVALLGAARRDPAARAAFWSALRGAAWVVRERRPVGPQVERVMSLIRDLPA